MDPITLKLITSAAIPATTALTAAAKWLNKKYNITNDIYQIHCLRQNAKFLQYLQSKHGDSDWSFYHTLHSTFGTNDYLEAFLFEDRSWTYAELRGEIGRLAVKFTEMGVKNRMVVGMYINNSPEFIMAWWALYKLGAIPAPVNTSITQEPFRHCLRVSDAEMLITTYELFDAAAESFGPTSVDFDHNGTIGLKSEDLPKLKKLVLYDYDTYASSDSALPNAESYALRQASLPFRPAMADWPAETRPKVGPGDASQYLFTSGTTGLPKAALWPTAYSMMGCGPYRYPKMFKIRRRTYISTPMFHGGAAFATLPATHATSGTVILARKFSVRNFWPDIRRTRADCIFYIGEMARFLVQAPPDPHHPDEKQHTLRVVYGLGITAPVWRAFRNRFGVPWIVEYYSASEATASICNSNWENDEGCGKVAHWGPIMRRYQDALHIIRIDLETGEILRDPETGFCQKCDFDEIGEGITRIREPLQRSHDYVGSAGKEATEKKLIRDVFEKGDLFFRAGDALSMNRAGYMQFHDRLGDTFRAKGHNVSTAEVEMAFLHHPHIKSVNVYSINMKNYGYEGQLGCAAVTVQQEAMNSSELLQSLQDLENWLVKKGGLAPYAVPRFLRVLVHGSAAKDLGVDSDLEGERVSLILKKLKTGLRGEALNVTPSSTDRLFWIEREGNGFQELDPEVLAALIAGRAKL